MEDRALLRLDANQGWTAKQAVYALQTLEDAGVKLELVEHLPAGPQNVLEGRALTDPESYIVRSEATLDECLRYHDASVGDVAAVGREWQLQLALSGIRLLAAKGDADGAVDLLGEAEKLYADLLDEGPHLARVERVGNAVRRGR